MILDRLVGWQARAIAAVVGVGAIALIGAGLWAWGYQVGDARSDARHAQAQAAAVAAAHAQYAQQVQQGDRAVLRQMERTAAAEAALEQVKKEVRHAPVTVFAAAPPGQQCPSTADVRLTAGAVRLWNSALAGADIPAGACGAAGAPRSACAALTEIDIPAAHANAVENGARFNACFQQLKSLIDRLDQRDAVSPTTPRPTPQGDSK